VTPHVDIIITPDSTPSLELDGFFSQQSTRRSQKGKEHVKQRGRLAAAVVSKPTLPNDHGTSTSSSSSATTTPLLLGEVEVPSSAPLLLRSVTTEPKENSGILVLTSTAKNDITLLNSTGAQEAPKLLEHETDLPPPIILQSKGSSEQKITTPPEGSVRRRVEEIEMSWGANHKQPPSMYTSVVAPLEVWVVQEPNSYAYPTIFHPINVPHIIIMFIFCYDSST
jgi:hypothetical protein